MTITTNAHEKLVDLLGRAENHGKVLRLFTNGFGWGGPKLDIALDEQRKHDDVVDVNGITIVYENSLTMFAKSVKIDYQSNPVWGTGFTIGTDYGC